MRKILMGAIASTVLMGMAAFGQEPSPEKKQPQQGEDSSITLQGCLTKGAEEQQYLLTNESSGRKLAFGGPSKLDEYLNQTVELKGRIVDRGGQSGFQAESVKTVTSSCKTSPPKN
jgi:hypothetical protein